MSRVYTASFQNISVTAQQDFFELAAADDVPVELLECHITQGSDMGDAAEEGLRVAIIRGNATSGSGGAAGTEVPTDPEDPAADTVVEVNNTTIASTGTEALLHEEQINSRVGFHYCPIPEARPKTNQAAGLLVVRLLTTPADALSVSGTIVWREG